MMDEIIWQFIGQLEHKEMLVIVAGLMFVNSAAMFPPSEYICIAAGIICAANSRGVYDVIAVATVANLMGTYVWYRLGVYHSYSGDDLTVSASGNKIWTSVKNLYLIMIPKIEKIYKSNGAIGVALLRLVPFIRSISSYPAGKIRMKENEFLVSSLIGIAVWVSIWSILGHMVGKNAYQYSFTIGLILGAISIVLYALIRRVFFSD